MMLRWEGTEHQLAWLAVLEAASVKRMRPRPHERTEHGTHEASNYFKIDPLITCRVNLRVLL